MRGARRQSSSGDKAGGGGWRVGERGQSREKRKSWTSAGGAGSKRPDRLTQGARILRMVGQRTGWLHGGKKGRGGFWG